MPFSGGKGELIEKACKTSLGEEERALATKKERIKKPH